MPRHFDTKEPRGFAFVTYESHSECVRASKEMNGQVTDCFNPRISF